MPVEFLTGDQVAAYGQFARPLTLAELDRCFLFDNADRERIDRRYRDHNRLGFAVQLGTVRFLGTFLPNPTAVSEEVAEYVAGKLGVDPACLSLYAKRVATQHAHAREIREAYGYQEMAEAEPALRDFIAARAWTSPEGPRTLFDHARVWLIGKKVLLPGVWVLARLVASVRAEVSDRLWRTIDATIDPELRTRLRRLLEVDAGARTSGLDRLRTSPTRVSGVELALALERVRAVAEIGATRADLSGVPPSRLTAVARYGMAAKAPHLRQLTEPRRSATLMATVQRLESTAIDDALDLFDVLMTSKLLGRAERESVAERLRALPRLSQASAKLAAAIQVVMAATEAGEDVTLTQIREQIARVVPWGELAAAVAAVVELLPPADEDADEAWRAEILKGYPTVRPFLPILTEVIEFDAVEAGQEIVTALRRLPELLVRKRVRAGEIAGSLVTGSWKRLVHGAPGSASGVIDHRAYTFCVLDHLHRALRRRDVFAVRSDRWGDPRARLLAGESWQETRTTVLTALGLPEAADDHLAELASQLDTAYREVASRLPDNAALEIAGDGERISLSRLEAVPEPSSLVELRDLVGRMLPRVDLPDQILEVHNWTGCLDEYTHVSEAGARMEDLPLSVAAVLVAEACNIGFEPVVKPSIPALTRDRLSHVDQNYVRAETHRAANRRLIEYQAQIELALVWGGGLVAGADGLRFVVPVATISAGANPHYFGHRRGATWLNAVNDRYSGIGAIVIPGTVRDSLYILDLLLNLEGGPRPEMVVTDTASYSDIVFGLFRILGYQFSPRIRDLGDTRFWRIDPSADYGSLNGVARSRVSLARIRESWPDMLRVAGSLHTGAVRAYDLIRMLSRDGHPSGLGQAFAEYGRIAKTLHLLPFIDIDDSYRRQVNAQLNIGEGRHQLARRIFHGQRGELRQHYREGQEDQLGALGLVLNVVVLWTTRYMDAALRQLRQTGYPVGDDDVVRLSPLGFRHVNFHGRYSFTPFEAGRLRPLREPNALDDEEEQ